MDRPLANMNTQQSIESKLFVIKHKPSNSLAAEADPPQHVEKETKASPDFEIIVFR